jgi:hypothetical protein
LLHGDIMGDVSTQFKVILFIFQSSVGASSPISQTCLLSIKDNPLQRTIQVSNTWLIRSHEGPHRVLNPNLLLYITIHTYILRYEIFAPPILNTPYSSFKYWLERQSANIFADTFPPKGTRNRPFTVNNLQQPACQHKLRLSFLNHQFNNL